MKVAASEKKLNRICLLNPHGHMTVPPPLGKTDTGGQTIYVLQMAKALGRKNIKVDIITRQFDNQPEEQQVDEHVRIVRIPCGPKTFVPKEKMYELVPEMMENFMHYIERKRKKYDIIHSHYWDGGYAGIVLSKMLDIPHVHTPHSSGKLKKLELAVEKLPVAKLKPAYRYHVRIAIEQKILNKAHAIVVICETSRIQLLQYYIVDFEKVHVIYPGVDTSHFNPEKKAVDKTIEMHKNAILTMSRIAPAKGLDRVVEAVSLLKNKVDFHLYMGGSTQTEASPSSEEATTTAQLKEMIQRYRLQDKVSFLGNVNHDHTLPAYYRNAEIFVLASRFEPFGLTTLEAMACGNVPIVSNVAGSREIIVDGLNGYIIDTHDRKALATLLEKLLTDDKLRKKIAANAAFTIKEHYSWDKIIDKFLALYRTLL